MKEVRKVIDMSAFRAPVLGEYLSKSPNNFIVICQSAQMEMLKGEAKVNLEKSLEVASRHADQIIVLKPDLKIARIDPKSKGLQNRLICPDSTIGFSKFCQDIFSGKANKGSLEQHIFGEQRQVVQYFNNLKERRDEFYDVMAEARRRYTESEIKQLRTQRPFPALPLQTIIEEVFCSSANLLTGKIGPATVPPLENAPFSFQFRIILCHRLLVFYWIKTGGYETMTKEKYSNDYTDMSYAAYATFFDGLITKDQKLMEIYQTARRLIEEILKSDWRSTLKALHSRGSQ